MDTLKQVLANLEKHDMHVHLLDHKSGYKGFKYPLAMLLTSTHFVMQGSEIVHVGNLMSINAFALRLNN